MIIFVVLLRQVQQNVFQFVDDFVWQQIFSAISFICNYDCTNSGASSRIFLKLFTKMFSAEICQHSLPLPFLIQIDCIMRNNCLQQFKKSYISDEFFRLTCEALCDNCRILA